MSAVELLNQSLEQVVEKMGDPTKILFKQMYELYPEFRQFEDQDGDWQNYMMQEVVTNLFQFVEDPDTAKATIRDMTSHHQLIGVNSEIFKGFYDVLLKQISETLEGPEREQMLGVWQDTVNEIQQCIDNSNLLY